MNRLSLLSVAFALILFLPFGRLSAQSKTSYVRDHWTQGGSALKLHLIPKVWGDLQVLQGGVSWQKSISRQLAFDFTVTAGKTSLRDGFTNKYFLVSPELRWYPSRGIKENKRVHAYIPLFAAQASGRYTDPSIIYCFGPPHERWTWTGAGTGAGVQIDILERYQLELMLGLACGRESWRYDDKEQNYFPAGYLSAYHRARMIPRARVQFVIPLGAK